jgi:hypothetical protein
MTPDSPLPDEQRAAMAVAPRAAMVAVMSAADSSRVGLAKEALAAKKVIEAGETSDNPLVADACKVNVETGLAGLDAATIREHALIRLYDASKILDELPVDDAAGFRAWVMECCDSVANAAKSGGGGLFRKKGAEAVTEAERVRIGEVSESLAGRPPAE